MRRNWRASGVVGAVLLAVAGLAAPAQAAEPVTAHLCDNPGFGAAFTADARYLAYDCAGQIVVRELATGHSEVVSVAGDGRPANRASGQPAISADGAIVAFLSSADNLVPGDTNGVADIFVRDRRAGTTIRANVSGSGAQGDGWVAAPQVSADGRVVAFATDSGRLVAGDTNGAGDVFARDLRTGTIVRASVAGDGTQGNSTSGSPAISADGNLVAFMSWASNLVAGDTNRTADVFVRDLNKGTTEQANVSSTGAPGNPGEDVSFEAGKLPAISADGRFVAFQSYSNNLAADDTDRFADTFVRDRWTGTTEQVSIPAAAASPVRGFGSEGPVYLSADGRFAVFATSENLVPGASTGTGPDIVVRDRSAGTTTRLPLTSAGGTGNGHANLWAVSDDTRAVVFESETDGLIPGDNDGLPDLFLYR